MISPALGENTSHQITLIEVHDNIIAYLLSIVWKMTIANDK
jgi:hypothetical protein